MFRLYVRLMTNALHIFQSILSQMVRLTLITEINYLNLHVFSHFLRRPMIYVIRRNKNICIYCIYLLIPYHFHEVNQVYTAMHLLQLSLQN